MHLFHIPHCFIQNRNVHISVLNGALWDMEQMHSGICELGQLYHSNEEPSGNSLTYCEHPPPFFFKFIIIWAFIYEAPAGEWYGRAAGPSDLCGALAAPTGVFLVDHVTGCVNLKCWHHNLLQSNKAVLMSCCVDLEPLYCLVDVDVYWSSYCKNRDIVF